MADLKKRISTLEEKAGLINVTPFAEWCKERDPNWRGTDYQAYVTWLNDQLDRHDEKQADDADDDAL